MARTFRNTAGYTPVKRAVRGSTPSTATRFMRIIPKPGRHTPPAGPQEAAPPTPPRGGAKSRRGVTAQQQRAVNDQRARDLETAENLEIQADRLTAARLNGRVPWAEIDAAGELAEELRAQAWAIKEAHGFIRPSAYSTAEIDRFFISIDPYSTSAELLYLLEDGSPRVTMQALLSSERRTQARLAAAERLG